MAKRIGKQRNKVDPILQLAEKNRLRSITVQQDEKNKRTEKNEKLKQKKTHIWQNEEDPLIAHLDADKLFKEMKRRDF
jgi:hypothetical protein